MTALLLLGSGAGCVGGNLAGAPVCGPLEELQALPERSACEDASLRTYRAELEALSLRPGSKRMVRVELDETARVRRVCVERPESGSTVRARQTIAENLAALHALPPGPGCLAGRRLDLNRYRAAIAEIEAVQHRCEAQVRTSQRAMAGVYPTHRVFEREFETCMRRDADWIVLHATGSTRPIVFVRPEIADPPSGSAPDTASRCARTARGFEAQSACIEADGWEQLVPPMP